MVTPSELRIDWLYFHYMRAYGLGGWAGLDEGKTRANFERAVQQPGEIGRLERLTRARWEILRARGVPYCADPMGFWIEPTRPSVQ